MDLLAALLRIFYAAPLLPLGLAWWLAAAWARKQKLSMWWLGLLVALTYLHKNRKDLRGVIRWCVGVGLAVMWLAVLRSPRYRFAFGMALPIGAFAAAWCWYATSPYRHLPIVAGVRAALADRGQREVLVDAVEASAPGARVVADSVKVAADGSFDAEIIGPPGVSHADLLAGLRDTLAESVFSISGRAMANVAVVGNGARGAVKVRGALEDPYAKTMTLDEVRRAGDA